VLAPGRLTLSMPATINNIIGKLTFTAQSLTGSEPGVTGLPRISYKLMEVSFKAKTIGVSDIHLTDVMLLNSQGENMPIHIMDVFTVVWGGVSYQNIIFTNSTGTTRTKLHTHTFDFAEKQLSFNITSSRALAPTGYCNILIPKELLYAPPDQWIVLVNGDPVTPIITEYAAQTSLYFTYKHIDGEIQIKIIGTTVLGE